MRIFIRELQKALLQYCILPVAYKLTFSKRVDNNLVIFADAKHDDIPYSMQAMYKEVLSRNYDIENLCYDYSKLSVWNKLMKSIEFMRAFSKARYVFICDYFLPVSSCSKRHETKVIQLWHASGLQKKLGYDANDDLAGMLFCRPTRNFDLVCVSAEIVEPVFANAWRLPLEKVRALGFSRTDLLYDEVYAESCRKKFFENYPEAVGKRIVMWAPTFRGNGADGNLVGIEAVKSVVEQLGEEYFFIIKVHPNMAKKYNLDNCSLNTEELYFVIDTLITDYSSVFYDCLLLDKNIIFFVPDYDEYLRERGMYVDYRKEFGFDIALSEEELLACIRQNKKISDELRKQYKDKFLKSCDGSVSARIIHCLED